MQFGSLGLVGTGIGIALLAIALAITFGVPVLAVPFVLIAFVILQVARAKRRSHGSESTYQSQRSQVPSTEETAADPVADSSVDDAVRAGGDAQVGHEARSSNT